MKDYSSMQPPELKVLLKDFHPLPAYSLVLGVCEDRLPLILDLKETGVGAFLIVSDRAASNRRIINVILDSAYLHTTRYQVSIHILTSEKEQWHPARGKLQVRNIISLGDPLVPDLIAELLALMETREDGRLRLPVHLLVIEDFIGLAESLPPEVYRKLLILIQQGPFWGLWVIASMTTGQLQEKYYEGIERFPSRIVGKIEEAALARYFTGLPRANLQELTPEEARVRVGGDVFSVWIPGSKAE
jgi:hypothetical protein